MAEILEIIKDIPGLKIDQETGLPYFETVPEGFIQATFDDFHVMGKKKIGLLYLIHGANWQVLFPKIVDERLKAEQILPWMKLGRVYVKKKL